MLIDTHAHLNFNAYKDDAQEVVRRSLDGGVWMINVGSQYSSSKRAVETAEKYQEGVYAAIGLHPIYAQDGFDQQKYRELTESKKVLAIGEIGLDYKPEYSLFKESQRIVLRQQMEIAKELSLPIIFHCRIAHRDLLKIISNFQFSISKPGVVHCFTGDWVQAEKYMEMGLYLGFNGIIFKMNLDETIKKTPLDKILIETDCPYLTPPQAEGRNEPIYVKYVAEKIAEVKNLSFEKVAEQTTANAKNLFRI